LAVIFFIPWLKSIFNLFSQKKFPGKNGGFPGGVDASYAVAKKE
jgi:hypothetical protein